MIMDTSYQKRMAAKILKVSPKRVKVAQDKDIEESLTRNDIRHLIKKKLVTKKPKKGVSRVKANYLASQKKKGRRKGRGKKSGTKHSRLDRKGKWMVTVRALRSLLRELRDNGQIDKGTYSRFYRKAKGSEFRNRKHLLSYLKEKELLKGSKRGGKSGKSG
jgi:large subunit ribosomal protein L19e